jgi:hypothetical protein
MNRTNMLAMSVALAAQGSVFGGVVIHTSYASWSAAVGGGDAKIDFNLGSGQELFDQYGYLGAHFGGTLQTGTTSGDADGWAAVTLFPTFAMTVDFDSDQTGAAFDLVWLFRASLYNNGTLVGEVPQLNTGGPVFRGITSDQPFDRLVLQALPGGVPGSLNNMYIGNPIPGPAGAGVLVLALLRGRRRRA